MRSGSSGGGETSGAADVKSSADPLKVRRECTRDSTAVLAGIKWAIRLAIRNAKISSSAIIAMVDSVSYPVSKMDWLKSRANST
jgi:hypothetical protein